MLNPKKPIGFAFWRFCIIFFFPSEMHTRSVIMVSFEYLIFRIADSTRSQFYSWSFVHSFVRSAKNMPFSSRFYCAHTHIHNKIWCVATAKWMDAFVVLSHFAYNYSTHTHIHIHTHLWDNFVRFSLYLLLLLKSWWIARMRHRIGTKEYCAEKPNNHACSSCKQTIDQTHICESVREW